MMRALREKFEVKMLKLGANPELYETFWKIPKMHQKIAQR